MSIPPSCFPLVHCPLDEICLLLGKQGLTMLECQILFPRGESGTELFAKVQRHKEIDELVHVATVIAVEEFIGPTRFRAQLLVQEIDIRCPLEILGSWRGRGTTKSLRDQTLDKCVLLEEFASGFDIEGDAFSLFQLGLGIASFIV